MIPVLQRALLSVFVLVVVEQVFFRFSGAWRLVPDAAAYLRFLGLCLALAAVTAVPLALFVKVFDVLVARFRTHAWLANPALGRNVQAVTLLLLGALMAVCQNGEFLRPAPLGSMALFLLPGAVLLLAPRALFARFDGPKYNAAAACSVALIAWYLARYEVLDRFLRGLYGLADESLLRALIDLGVPASFVLASVLLASPIRFAPTRRLRIALLLAASCALFVLEWINATFFVDLHLPVHTSLLMASALIAWYVSSLWFQPVRARGIVRKLIGAAPWLGLAATLALSPRTNAGYLAAQHTALARFGMELVYEFGGQLDVRVGEGIGIAKRAAHVLRKKALPPSPLPLPSTFARPVVDPAARVDASGAVIFFLDMKRARDIGPDAYGRTRTPRIDRCFAGGFEFTRAYSSSTRTLTVFTSIYSSTYAGSRGQTRPDLALTPHWFAYQNGHHNLVDTMRGAGFRTEALTNRYYLRYLRDAGERPMFGKFDEIIESEEWRGQNPGLLAALATSPPRIPPSGRFLLVVHIMSHSLDELDGVDAIVGEVCDLVKRAGRARDSVLMLTADHGVQFGEHGRQTYGRTLYQEELHVPLLWRIPGMEGQVVEDPVSALDHFPTLLDLFQVPVPFALEGRSYARAFRGEPLDPNRTIFFEVRRHEVPSVGVVRQELKLIRWPRTGTTALFSLGDDPGETRNLVDEAAFGNDFLELDRLLSRFVAERH